jgi:hypothetical protein
LLWPFDVSQIVDGQRHEFLPLGRPAMSVRVSKPPHNLSYQ